MSSVPYTYKTYGNTMTNILRVLCMIAAPKSEIEQRIDLASGGACLYESPQLTKRLLQARAPDPVQCTDSRTKSSKRSSLYSSKREEWHVQSMSDVPAISSSHCTCSFTSPH